MEKWFIIEKSSLEQANALINYIMIFGLLPFVVLVEMY
jgi:hypothetical protein